MPSQLETEEELMGHRYFFDTLYKFFGPGTCWQWALGRGRWLNWSGIMESPSQARMKLWSGFFAPESATRIWSWPRDTWVSRVYSDTNLSVWSVSFSASFVVFLGRASLYWTHKMSVACVLWVCGVHANKTRHSRHMCSSIHFCANFT